MSPAVLVKIPSLLEIESSQLRQKNARAVDKEAQGIWEWGNPGCFQRAGKAVSTALAS